ncbi:hypothetical protein [Sinomonas sp. P10A9]|uniref:Uncharacterized protein n=1 Tax=Sinomonas puerhi TaxID=3238584 RepID=A0AB39L7N2_9MICC
MTSLIGPLVIVPEDLLPAFIAAIEARPCPDCNAEVLHLHDPSGAVHRCVIRHEDSCPSYRAGLNRAQRRAAARKEQRK